MALLSLVASHHHRDLALLEQLSIGSESLGPAIVAAEPTVSGAAVLPTCNRFEVHLDAADADRAREAVVQLVAERSALPTAVVAAALVEHRGDDAVQHLLSVAAGLESMVVGEREISGQVRRAHAEARAAGHMSPALDRLFQSALRTAREVAASTGLGTSGRSVVSVAFDLADTSVTWNGARVLLLGTGALAETAVGALRARRARVVGVCSPSGRGAAFAERHDIALLGLADLATQLGHADLVVACSGGESVVLTRAVVAEARAGIESPLTIIDLALHRDVSPGVADLRGVRVIDLETVGALAPGASPQALETAHSIVAHAVARFGDGESARALDPAVVALREHVFELLEGELARIRPRSGADKESIARAEATEEALRRFARTLLHTPTVRARELADAGQTEKYVAAVGTLYGLDVSASPADRGSTDPGTHRH